MISERALQRSTFLHERDSLGDPVKNYVVDSQVAKDMLSGDLGLDSRLQAILHGLNSHSASIRAGHVPEWVLFLKILDGSSAAEFTQTVPDLLAQIIENDCGDSAYATPFIHVAKFYAASVASHCRALSIVFSEPEVLANLTRWHIFRLTHIARFVLHCRFKDSSMPYEAWCRMFLRSDSRNPWASLSHEYPVLIRWLNQVHTDCLNSTLELFNRFAADRCAITDTFDICSLGPIVKIKPGLSDPHRHGRSVVELTFSNGDSIIYKPKPVDIDSYLYTHCEHLNSVIGIHHLSVLPRVGYGWVQHVDNVKTNIDPAYLPDRLGSAAAFFWLLNATDMHSENIIVRDGSIFALDIETLLASPATNQIETVHDEWRNHSIFSTLLFDFNPGSVPRNNISGFAPFISPDVPSISVDFVIDDDDVVIDQDSHSSPHSPELQSFQNWNSTDSSATIQAFHESSFGETKSAAQAFVDNLPPETRTRVVLRDTRFYWRFHEMLSQPRFLRDGAIYDIQMSSLYCGVSTSINERDKWYSTIDDEIHQLRRGDIPYFWKSVASMSLETSSGQHAEFFSASGIEWARAKISGVEHCDVVEQAALLKMAIRPDQTDSSVASTQVVFAHNPEPQAEELQHSLANSIVQLAEHIVKCAIVPINQRARWLSMSGDVSCRESQVLTGDTSFFSGSLGVLVGLEAASLVARTSSIASPIDVFLDHEASSLLNTIMPTGIAPGQSLGFVGVGGDIFACATLITLNTDRWGYLRHHIESVLDACVSAIEADHWLDIIGGVSGLAIACRQLCSNDVFSEIKHHAVLVVEKCAAHLITSSHNTGEGSTWVVPGNHDPLMGYAHGWAGIIAALSLARDTTRDSMLRHKIDTCIHEAIVFPDSILKTDGKWGDYRSGRENADYSNNSWCNGAVGFIRGLCSVPDVWTTEIKDEICMLVQSLAKSSQDPATVRFCCGQMGSIDLLLDLSRKPCSYQIKNPDFLSTVANQAVNKVFLRTKTQIPECIFPSLFHGQAGIVYTASRCLQAKIPSLSGQDFSLLPELNMK